MPRAAWYALPIAPEGRLLFSRQSPQDESNVGEKLPELFDIHVMFFADTSSEGISALQKAFGLERSVAEKLVSEVPVMVKRAASPEVADSLLDLLNALGAQVVLLPSTATPSIVPDDSSAGLLNAGWGGLDLKLPSEVRPAPGPAALPAVAFLDVSGELDGVPSRPALSEPPLPVVSRAMDSPAPASVPAPIPVPVLAQAAREKAAAEADTPYAERFALDDRTSSLELAQLEPTPPRVFPVHRAHHETTAAGAGDSLELDLGESPEAGDAGTADPRSPAADLGLGSVPPLPSAAKAVPPRPPVPKPAPAVATRAQGGKPPPSPPEPRLAKPAPSPSSRPPSDVSQSAVLPDLQLAVPEAGDPYWSAKRRAAHTAGGVLPSGSRPPLAISAAEQEARHRADLSEQASPRSRALGAIVFLIGGLALAAAAYFDALVFTGSASVPWMLLQALAFFSVGWGLVRMRR